MQVHSKKTVLSSHTFGRLTINVFVVHMGSDRAGSSSMAASAAAASSSIFACTKIAMRSANAGALHATCTFGLLHAFVCTFR